MDNWYLQFNMDESQTYYAKYKKAILKGYKLYDSTDRTWKSEAKSSLLYLCVVYL